MKMLTEKLIEMEQLFTLSSSFILCGLLLSVFLISMIIAEICLKEK